MRRKPNDLKLQTLRATPGLDRCRDAELVELGRVSDELDFPAGHTLTREGASDGETFVILHGRVEVRRFGVLLWEAGPGSMVGDLRVLGGLPASVTVQATTDLRVLLLERRAADTILRSPDLARWAFANLQRHIREVIGASTDPAPVRTARLRLAEPVPA